MNNLAAQNILSEALRLANINMLIFPVHGIVNGYCSCKQGSACSSSGKHPIIKDWQNLASSDHHQINDWWHEYPYANIGLLTGLKNGFFVLDLDPRNGSEASIQALEAQYGGIPITVTQKTGGGGIHYLFRYPDETSTIIKSKPLSGYNGIDIKGEGGFVVAAPSNHISGNNYEWEQGASLFQEGVALEDAPPWLISLVASQIHETQKVEPSISSSLIPIGQRNTMLTSFAGVMRRKGICSEAIEAALLRINEIQCESRLEIGEIQNIAESVCRYPQGQLDVKTQEIPIVDEEAYYGLAGDYVRLIEPETEAHPMAILTQFLVAFGNVIGRKVYFKVEGTEHQANLFVAIVGNTSAGRKGTSLGHIRETFSKIDGEWHKKCNASGLSSGEGIIWRIRDAVENLIPKKQNSKNNSTPKKDPGVSDKRLMIIESEFVSVCNSMNRESNKLSSVLRQAWDGDNLSVLNKNEPYNATEPHVSLIVHTTRAELLKSFKSVEMANGFGNRFLWICVKRTKCLSEGGHVDETALQKIEMQIKECIDFVKNLPSRICIEFDEEGRELWKQIYPELTEELPGMLGAMVARGAPIVRRNACIYAVLDKSSIIKITHLKAALALFKYSHQSVNYIFKDNLIGQDANKLLNFIKKHHDGVSRTQIRDLFHRNQNAEFIENLLNALEAEGFIYRKEISDRAAEIWFATTYDHTTKTTTNSEPSGRSVVHSSENKKEGLKL